MRTIRRSDAACGRCSPAVVINDKRIFPVRVESRRQAYHTLNLRTVFRREVPLLHCAHIYLVQNGLHRIGKQNGCFLLHIIRIGNSHTGIATTDIGGNRRIVLRQVEGRNHIFLKRQHFKTLRLRHIAIDMSAIFVRCIEVDTAVYTVPLQEVDGRIEIARDGISLFRGLVHNECLSIEIIGDGMLAAVFPYSVKSHRTADYQKLSAVGRVSRPVYIRVPRHQRICLQRSQIQLEDGSKRERTLSDIRFRGGTQEFLAVRGYIIQINGMAAVSETFGKSGDRVVPNEIVAGTRIGNPVVGMQQPLQRTAYRFSLIIRRVNKIVFCRRPCKISLGNIFQQHFLAHGSRVEHNQIIPLPACYGIIKLIAAGHPTHFLIGSGQYHPARLQFGQFTTCP